VKLDGVRAKFDAKRPATVKVEAPAAAQGIAGRVGTLGDVIDVVSRYVCDGLGKVDRKRLVEMRNLVDSLTKRATHTFYTDEIAPMATTAREPELPKIGRAPSKTSPGVPTPAPGARDSTPETAPASRTRAAASAGKRADPSPSVGRTLWARCPAPAAFDEDEPGGVPRGGEGWPDDL